MGEDVFLFCKSLREVTLSASFTELPDLNTRMSSSAPSLVRFYGEAEETYLKYIKSNKKKLWADRDILRQLLEESYITSADLEALLDDAGKREDTETSAMLLEYQEKTLSRKSVEKRFKL